MLNKSLHYTALKFSETNLQTDIPDLHLLRRPKFVESESRKLTLLLLEPQERMFKIYSDPFNCVHVTAEITRRTRKHIRCTAFNFSSFNAGTLSECTLSHASPLSLFFQTNVFLSVFVSTIDIPVRVHSLLSTSVLLLNVIHQSAAPTGFASIFYVVPVKQVYALSPSSEFEHVMQERGL